MASAESINDRVAQIREYVGEVEPYSSPCLTQVVRQGVQVTRLADLLREKAKGFDLVFLDPALAYIGGDAMQARDVGQFLREHINPVIDELNIGIFIVHHSNKPLRGTEKDNWQAGDFAYLGAGSAEWTNWARCVIVIRSIGKEDIFELRAPKRGKRLKWLARDGSATTQKLIGYGESGIYWRELPEEVVPRDTKKDADLPISAYLGNACDLVRSKVWLVGEFKERIKTEFGLSDKKMGVLYALVRDTDGIRQDRAPNIGTAPVHLIGEESAVLAEKDRLYAESKKPRQSSLGV